MSPLPHVLRPLDQLAEPALVRKTGRDALDRAVRGLASVAVLVVDLDDFEGVNRSLGHEAGIGCSGSCERLEGSAGPENTVALLYGDEFAVLLEDVPNKSSAISVARRIGEALRDLVELDGSEVLINASIGLPSGAWIGGTKPRTSCATWMSPCTRLRGRAKHATGCSTRALIPPLRNVP